MTRRRKADAGSEKQSPRARPEIVPRTLRAERVRHITDLMSKGEWERGDTAKALAEEWDMSVKTVRSYATEASRILQLSTADLETYEQAIRQAAWDIVHQQGNDRVQALTLLAKNRGLLRDKLDTTTKQVDIPTEKVLDMAREELLSDPEQRELLRKALAEREN